MKFWKVLVYFLVLLIVIPQVVFTVMQLLFNILIPEWLINNMMLNIFITNNIAAGLSIYLYYKANKVADIEEWKKKGKELIKNLSDEDYKIPEPE